jgi:hypothetical protein
MNRVVNGNPPIRPCPACGAIGVVRYESAKSPGWTVVCPNRATVAERKYNRDGKCSNTKIRWRTTKSAAISVWNVECNPNRRKNYDAAEDLRKPRAFCRCGLSLPCNGCLEGTNGFQRKSSYDDASRRVRMSS